MTRGGRARVGSGASKNPVPHPSMLGSAGAPTNRGLSRVDPDANPAEIGREAERDYLRRRMPELRRANLALFVAGVATFAMLYCTQPLLPTFSAEFGVTPTVASLSLSLATATLAVALVLAGSFSEAWGRTPIMTASLLLSSLLMVLTAFSPDFVALLALRAVQGVALAGLP